MIAKVEMPDCSSKSMMRCFIHKVGSATHDRFGCGMMIRTLACRV